MLDNYRKKKLEKENTAKAEDRIDIFNKKINTPIQNNFSVQEIKKLKSKDFRKATSIFHKIFKDLRKKKDKLEKLNPFESYEENLIYLVCQANKMHIHTLNNINNFDLYSSKNGNYSYENQSAINIYSFSKALLKCIIYIKNKEKISTKCSKSDKKGFLAKEINLSNLYEYCENCFNEMIYFDYEITKKYGNIILKEMFSEYNITRINSLIRKDMIERENYLFFLQKIIDRQNKKNQPFICLKTLCIKENILSKSKFSEFIYFEEKINLIYPKNILNNKIKNKTFSIQNILEVFKHIFLALDDYLLEYQKKENTNFKTPIINKKIFLDLLNKITRIEIDILIDILDFLSYGQKKDLRSNPILTTDDNYIFFIASFIEIDLSYAIDSWFSILKYDIGVKGKHFENFIINSFNEASNLKNDRAFGKILTLNNKKYEFDFLYKINNKILLGELKNLPSTVFPAQIYKTFLEAKHAKMQLDERKKSIKDNFEEFCKKLNWKFDKYEDVEIIDFILINNKFLTGFKLDNTFIIDEDIFLKYFKNSNNIDKKLKNFKNYIKYNISSKCNYNEYNYIDYNKFIKKLHFSKLEVKSENSSFYY